MVSWPNTALLALAVVIRKHQGRRSYFESVGGVGGGGWLVTQSVWGWGVAEDIFSQ